MRRSAGLGCVGLLVLLSGAPARAQVVYDLSGTLTNEPATGDDYSVTLAPFDQPAQAVTFSYSAAADDFSVSSAGSPVTFESTPGSGTGSFNYETQFAAPVDEMFYELQLSAADLTNPMNDIAVSVTSLPDNPGNVEPTNGDVCFTPGTTFTFTGSGTSAAANFLINGMGVSVPELDPASIVAPIALLGSLGLLLSDRRRKVAP